MNAAAKCSQDELHHGTFSYTSLPTARLLDLQQCSQIKIHKKKDNKTSAFLCSKELV